CGNEVSEVWGYFKKVVWTKERKTARCNVKNCTKKEYSCGKDGTTRPLWQHLESAHQAQYILTEEYHTSTIVSTEVDNMKLHKMVATWIINRQRQLSIVEDPELIEILIYLNPTVQLVKADTIKTTIMTLYSLGKQKLRTYLFNISSKLFFTLDLWTSPNNKSYISDMAHYIDENWALKEITIDFGLLSRKHDGVNIANGELNLVICATPQRIELFESICNACRIKFIKPILDCPTRWNSTHDTIKNGLFLKSALNTLTSSHDDFHPYAITHN
ncbi:3561_t:CDS:2, partial [Gigaspora rosea]